MHKKIFIEKLSIHDGYYAGKCNDGRHNGIFIAVPSLAKFKLLFGSFSNGAEEITLPYENFEESLKQYECR